MKNHQSNEKGKPDGRVNIIIEIVECLDDEFGIDVVSDFLNKIYDSVRIRTDL